jgi:hypothetical protein
MPEINLVHSIVNWFLDTLLASGHASSFLEGWGSAPTLAPLLFASHQPGIAPANLGQCLWRRRQGRIPSAPVV